MYPIAFTMVSFGIADRSHRGFRRVLAILICIVAVKKSNHLNETIANEISTTYSLLLSTVQKPIKIHRLGCIV